MSNYSILLSCKIQTTKVVYVVFPYFPWSFKICCMSLIISHSTLKPWHTQFGNCNTRCMTVKGERLYVCSCVIDTFSWSVCAKLPGWLFFNHFIIYIENGYFIRFCLSVDFYIYMKCLHVKKFESIYWNFMTKNYTPQQE